MAVNLPCLWGSCPNFLRPTCPYTECQQSSFTGSCPTENTPAGYGSCLCWFITDQASSGGSDKPVDASPPYSALPVGTDAVGPTPSFTGSFSRTLPGLLLSSGPAGPWRMRLCTVKPNAYAACASAAVGCLMSLSIFVGSYFCPVLRIVKMTRRILQAITISDCIFFNGLSGRVV